MNGIRELSTGFPTGVDNYVDVISVSPSRVAALTGVTARVLKGRFVAESATQDLTRLWFDGLTRILGDVVSPVQRQWLEETQPVGFSEGTMIVASPHAFAREWLERSYRHMLVTSLSDVAGYPIEIIITVQPQGPENTDSLNLASVTPLKDPVRQQTISDDYFKTPEQLNGGGSTPVSGQLNPKYTFDDFVIGASNRFAHAAATAVAEAPAKSYNPLFIYGGAGLGKTHLLHAIGHYAEHLYPRLKVRYVTTEQFTNEFINAIRHDKITQFQQTYRAVDVLLIDDIQFLEDKERTQEEFFHTFNALHNAEKQIVISSDRPPKQISHLEDRLRSRFEWGLMTDVQPPDLETRIAILRKKAESDRLQVGADVLEFIASKVQSNIRELEGSLIRVTAFASLQRSIADVTLAETVLKDLFPTGGNQAISVDVIMDRVAEYFDITKADLCSPARNRQLVMARQIAMYLTRELTELSLPRIGKAFGGRDHTTVMHAKSKVAELMQERRTVYNQVHELTNLIKSHTKNM